jgi:hypothetical protein
MRINLRSLPVIRGIITKIKLNIDVTTFSKDAKLVLPRATRVG